MAEAAEAIADGDLVDTKIHGYGLQYPPTLLEMKHDD